MSNIYYDIVGNELNIGDVVIAPMWQDKRLVIGTIAKLDYYSETSDRDDVVLHRVIIPKIDDRANYALWRGSSMFKLPDPDAIIARLRNFEPFEDERS
jgi:hypothetical protein